ncbi:MAG TPA: AbrB/MazE/SpoVT family DNA-binding domain-containing protein [Candidatus Babeliales bacterium]|nr:AbrB/MazE/SpoVT family DNA-binding domain-containing protein [Candidatus Babeliales bacterium]
MKLNLIKIGNSRGIRLPQSVLKQCNFQEVIVAEVKDGKLILSAPTATPRQGWQAAFEAMHAAGDDQLLDQATLELENDDQDWQW